MRGVRVLEVAQYTFTPAAGAVLADWGADVIKVEHAETGDAQRSLRLGTGAPAIGKFHPIMEHPNRGKRSIGLALEKPEAREVLYELAKLSDVFLVNFLPDARKKLKIDLEDIRKVNPKIIYVRGSGFGPKGDLAGQGGFDGSVFWGRAGSAHHATPSDSPRLVNMPAGAYGDSMGGMTIAGGISAALFSRERTGEPSEVDVSLLSVGAWAMALSVNQALMMGEAPPQAPLAMATAAFNPVVANYRTSDNRWINLTMLQAGRYWADFCKHIDRPELATDERFSTFDALTQNTAAAAEIITEVIGAKPFAYWLDKFKTLEGQWAPVQNALELGNDPQLRANGWVRPVVDADGIDRELILNPVLFDQTAPDIVRAPQFAEHTDEILAELGRTEDQILELKIAGAVT